MSRTRSQQMARIKGHDTSPEKRLRSALYASGLRYRVHYRTPAGRADVVFVKRAVAVYVDGCFWHGCPEHYVRPRSRGAFWRDKLRANVDRDRRQTLLLESQGWLVLRFWEHQVFEELDVVVAAVRRAVIEGAPQAGPQLRVARVEVVDEATDIERRSLEELRDGTRVSEVVGPRTTTKWRRPIAHGRRRR